MTQNEKYNGKRNQQCNAQGKNKKASTSRTTIQRKLIHHDTRDASSETAVEVVVPAATRVGGDCRLVVFCDEGCAEDDDNDVLGSNGVTARGEG
jgi:hypothetical protein